MTNAKIRVRFAPSPTGPLHIGGLRTAFFNFLFAKKNQGDFVLRIEDTDLKRFNTQAEKYIIDSLKWCGLNPDESPQVNGQYGPYRQSERLDIYKKYIKKLLENGHAYLAFDTPEELEKNRIISQKKNQAFSYNSSNRLKLRNSLSLSYNEVDDLIKNKTPHVIRFKIPKNKNIEIVDLIRGRIEVNSNTLDDKVLFKADGYPTYHFANVVDDYLMKISHVIRGEEWLPSLPLHVLLYKAFNWEINMPKFAHLPLILNPSGKGKLSKRDGAKLGFPVYPLKWYDENERIYIEGYKEKGILPQALLNMLVLLGWNPGIEKEFFSLDELIKEFDLKRVKKSGARFNPDKIIFFNHRHLQHYPIEKIALNLKHKLEEAGIDTNIEYVKKVCLLVKDRMNFLNDFYENTLYFFKSPNMFDEKVFNKNINKEVFFNLQKMKEIFSNISEFTTINIEKKLKTWIQSSNLGFGKIMNPLRLAIVGELKGPHLFDIIELIGKEETLSRINYFEKKIKSHMNDS